MDPQGIGADQWQAIARLLNFLFLFTALALTSALAFLLAHAVVPSLRATREATVFVTGVRWLAYPLSAISLVMTVYALARALALAVEVMERVYPRFWI